MPDDFVDDPDDNELKHPEQFAKLWLDSPGLLVFFYINIRKNLLT